MSDRTFLSVVEPGPASSLQDLGRYGLQRAGVPAAGALDRTALALANALVGRPLGAAAVEMRLVGGTFELCASSARLAVVGAAATLEVRRAASGETERVEVGPALWRTVTLRRGDMLRVGPLRGSATAYLAAAGGVDAPVHAGSSATLSRAGLGGHRGDGAFLAAGDTLVLAPQAGDEIAHGPDLGLSAPDLLPAIAGPVRARVVLGPQKDRFSDAGLDMFFGTEWVVTARADRMGLRLSGPTIEHAPAGPDIVSDGIVPGAIQVPGEGLPIVLLADRQTAGGYAKIGAAITADLGALGRARPGDTLRFQQISAADGVAAARAANAALRSALSRIAPMGPSELTSERLLSENLITARISDAD